MTRGEFLRPLQLPVLVVAATLTAALLLLFATGRYEGAMEEAHSALERESNDAGIRLIRARNRDASFRTDGEVYRRLERQGLKGPEQRLRWVTLMETLPGEARLGRSSYQLDAQRPYARIAGDEGGQLRFSATRVTLDLEAAHEGRLLDFLARLETRVPGLLVTRSCAFDANAPPLDQVRGHCVLDWITLDP